jgi:hypothetical protein
MSACPHVRHWVDVIGHLPMDLLKEHDPDVHDTLARLYGVPADGTLSGHLPEFLEQRIEARLQAIDDEETAKVEAVERADKEYIARQNKIAKNRNEAVARLEFYERKRGLVNCKANADKIIDWITNAPELQTAKGVFSAATVDLAISFLGPKGKNVLQWSQPKSVVELPPPAPDEKLGVCSDGLQQLPISTIPARHHSVAQLKDLDKRQREARGKSSDGWHGIGSL